MKRYRKHDFPTDQVRRFLEPGPVVLVSTAWNEERGIATMGWHMMLGWNLVGAYITAGTHSNRLARGSGECVINLPTLDLLDTAVGIGNCSGDDGDKFDRFGLTASPAARVQAPLIAECHSSFECMLLEAHDNADYDLFVWEVVQAHVAPVPKRPRTVHYRGNGEFMVSGRKCRGAGCFRPEMLEE